MERINPSPHGDTPFQRLLGHNKALLQEWGQLEEVLWTQTTLDAGLLEEVRRTLAFGNQCQYCMAKGAPSQTQAEERTALAVAFADFFLLDYLSIGVAHFDLLREHFSEKEVLELCAFISFTTASQRLGAVLNLQPQQEQGPSAGA